MQNFFCIICLFVLWSLSFQADSPAATELEVIVMDWLADMLKLPDEFMSGGQGGGVLQVIHVCCLN